MDREIGEFLVKLELKILSGCLFDGGWFEFVVRICIDVEKFKVMVLKDLVFV